MRHLAWHEFENDAVSEQCPVMSLMCSVAFATIFSQRVEGIVCCVLEIVGACFRSAIACLCHACRVFILRVGRAQQQIVLSQACSRAQHIRSVFERKHGRVQQMPIMFEHSMLALACCVLSFSTHVWLGGLAGLSSVRVAVSVMTYSV